MMDGGQRLEAGGWRAGIAASIKWWDGGLGDER